MTEDFLNVQAEENEMVAYWMFKKTLQLEVNKLDKDRTGKRPDFHVFKGNATKGFVCEVKSILSAGAGISTNNIGNLPSGGPFVFDPRPKFWSVLSDAVTQYRELVAAKPSFGTLPFVVGVFFDFFADIWSSIPRELKDYPLVSALIRVERSREQSQLFESMSSAEIKEVIEGKRKVRIPPDTKKWALIRNSAAVNPISVKWFGQCFEE